MRIAIALVLATTLGCGTSKRERCEAMTAHHEQITGHPMEPSMRADYVALCAQAATDDEIDCETRATTQADLNRCAGGP